MLVGAKGGFLFFSFLFFLFDREGKDEGGFHRNVGGVVLGKRNTLLKDHRRRERVDYREFRHDSASNDFDFLFASRRCIT